MNRWLFGGLALSFLAGCAEHGGLYGAKDNWGEAYRQTLAAQVVDPAPQYEDPVPSTSGQTVAGAIERYRTDKVKKPDRVQTSRSVTGGSGGT